ncbi:hypothetical protein NMG60_11036982 [Bertholletia excelsa]
MAFTLRHLATFPPTPSSLTTRLLRSVSTSSSPTGKHFSGRVMASVARKVLVPIANETEPMEAVITIDVLRRAGADVTVASVEKQLPVDAFHGMKIVADALISDCASILSLFGGMPGTATLRDCKILETIVNKQAAGGRLYAATCEAPAVALGSWGLLKGKNAVESRVHSDGKVLTTRGPGTAMEYSVALVEHLYGKDKANEVSGPLLLVVSVSFCLLFYPGMRPNHGDEYTVHKLNPVEWKFDHCPKILVPVADGTEEMEATIIIDILRRAKADVVVASVGDKLEIVASRQVKLVADMLLEEAVKVSYDLIVLPGGLGGAQAFAKSENLVNLLKKQKEANRAYGAICASPALVLEPQGLLKG